MAESQVDGDVQDCHDVMTSCDKSNYSNDSDEEDSLAGFEDDLEQNEEERDGDEPTSFTAAATSNGSRPSRRKRKSTDPSKRKRIRRILREDELKDVTISAQKEEKERLRRLELQRSLAVAASGAFSSVKSSENSVSLSASKASSPVAVDVREIKVDHPHVIVIDSDDEGGTVSTPIDCSHRRTPSESSNGDLIEIISSDSEIEIEESDNDDDSEGFERNDVDYNNSGTHVDDTVNQIDSHGRVLVNVNHPMDEEDIFLAPQIVKVIKPHQIGGIRFLYDNLVETLTRYNVSVGFGCILAHAMGLGKTLQVISFIDVFLRFTPGRKVMCIVPINTIQNWLAEFNMWLPPKPDLVADSKGAFVESSSDSTEMRYRDFEVFLLGDNLKSTLARAKVIGEWNQHGGVLLVGYELFRLLSTATPSMSSSKSLPSKKKKSSTCQDKSNGEPEVIDLDEEEKHMELLIGMQKALCRPGADLVICDEGHRIKNDQANTSQALKQIHTRRRMVLTGYPLQNNLQEYWCMVDFVRPNFLGTKQEFSNMFERPILNGQCSDSTPSDVRLMRFRAHVLHSLLEGFVQRRSQTVLKKCLPTKEEHIILVNLSPIQKELYHTFVQFLMDSVGYVNPVKGFHTCTKIWNHPDIFYRSLDIKANGKGNESPLTILDDCNEEGLNSQRAKGNGSGGSLSNSSSTYSLGNQQTEANSTCASSATSSQAMCLSPPDFSPLSTGQSHNSRSSLPTQGGVTPGSQIFTQTTARTTAQLGSTTSISKPHVSQCLVDRSMPVIQSMATQQSGCSFEGRLLPDMAWAQKVFKDYQLGVIENGGKLVVLMEIIQESLKLGEKILVFSQSLSTLSVIEEFLSKQDLPFFPGRVCDPLRPTRWARNKSYYRLDGSTTAQERERLINSFNSPDNKEILLFMLSTRAGCLGINLIGASRVVVFDASWNPCHDVQAVCRVYRYGQKKSVHIYRLISTGTMEKKIYDRQISKQGMADRVVDELNPEANFTKQEIMKLICEKEPVSSAPDFLSAADKFSDPVLIRLCRQCSQWLAKVPFKHDSLLVDRKELKLTKAEKREAKKGYEMEKRLAAQGARYCPAGVIQPVFNRNHLPYSLKPCPVLKPAVGSMRLPQSSTGNYVPHCLSSSLSVPIASLIRAGVNVVGQHPNHGTIPLKSAASNTGGLSDGILQPSQRSSCASDNEVVMIDLDELPSPTKPAQEPFSNLPIQPQQRIDSMVQRARNAFPNVSPALIGYLLNHSRGQPHTVYCNEPRDDCEVVDTAGSSRRVTMNDTSTNPQQSESEREHQTSKSAVVKSPSSREQVHVFVSPSPSTVQERPPLLNERPDNSSSLGEGNPESSTTGAEIPTCTEQPGPSCEGNG